jgi:hypothetical protein
MYAPRPHSSSPTCSTPLQFQFGRVLPGKNRTSSCTETTIYDANVRGILVISLSHYSRIVSIIRTAQMAQCRHGHHSMHRHIFIKIARARGKKTERERERERERGQKNIYRRGRRCTHANTQHTHTHSLTHSLTQMQPRMRSPPATLNVGIAQKKMKQRHRRAIGWMGLGSSEAVAYLDPEAYFGEGEVHGHAHI